MFATRRNPTHICSQEGDLRSERMSESENTDFSCFPVKHFHKYHFLPSKANVRVTAHFIRSNTFI